MQKITTRCQPGFVQISYRSPGILRKSFPSCVNSHDVGLVFSEPHLWSWPRKALRCFQLSFLVSWSQNRTLNIYSPAACIMRGTKSEFNSEEIECLGCGPVTPDTLIWQRPWSRQLVCLHPGLPNTSLTMGSADREAAAALSL